MKDEEVKYGYVMERKTKKLCIPVLIDFYLTSRRSHLNWPSTSIILTRSDLDVVDKTPLRFALFELMLAFGNNVAWQDDSNRLTHDFRLIVSLLVDTGCGGAQELLIDMEGSASQRPLAVTNTTPLLGVSR